MIFVAPGKLTPHCRILCDEWHCLANFIIYRVLNVSPIWCADYRRQGEVYIISTYFNTTPCPIFVIFVCHRQWLYLNFQLIAEIDFWITQNQHQLRFCSTVLTKIPNQSRKCLFPRSTFHQLSWHLFKSLPFFPSLSVYISYISLQRKCRRIYIYVYDIYGIHNINR